MIINQDDLVLTILRNNDYCELKKALDEKTISLDYKNKRNRNLIELSCMHASSECLSFLIDTKSFFIDPDDLISFILTKGEDNTDSLNTLAVFFSKKPEFIQTTCRSLSWHTPLEYFIHEGYLKYYQTTIQNDPYFDVDNLIDLLGKYDVALKRYSIDDEKVNSLVQFISLTIHEMAEQGMFLPLHVINNIKSYGKKFEQELNYYDLNIEKFMLEVSFAPNEKNNSKPINQKKKI